MIDDGWLVAQLSSEGQLAPDRLKAARERQTAEGGDLARHLFEVGGVDENALLRAIAIAHRTSYVTIDKLAKVRVTSDVLQRVPEEIASQHRLVPLSFDVASGTLALVAVDPSTDVLDVARQVSKASQVRAYVALPQAVDAAIRRFYHGDTGAFSLLEAQLRGQESQSMQIFLQDQASHPPPSGLYGIQRTPTGTVRGIGSSAGTSARATPGGSETAEDEFTRPEGTRRTTVPPPPSRTTQELLDGERPSTGEQRARAFADQPSVSMEAYLETLKVLVSASEMGSAPWRQGHAAEVARQARRLGARIGLAERELSEINVAAYLHDVGKPDEPHLTLLGILQVPAQKTLAERVWASTARLFDGAQLAPGVTAALGSLYERMDGQGLPRRRRGRDIPLGARILALVDAFVDLTMNPFGAAGGNVADRDAAMATLRRHKDTLFDGNLVDILQQLISGDDLRQRLLGDRPRVLLADGDAEATSMVELKLVAEGYEVRVARSTSEALRAMAQWAPDLVVSEVAIEPAGGFGLLEESRKHKRTADIPFFFLTERATAADLDRGFALGAVDYLTKPVAPDVLLVKVRRFVAERARARDVAPGRRVAGSLAEMAVADVIQVLAKGKKTGALRLVMPGTTGDLWLDGGKIVHAACPPDLAGQEALFKLLRGREGEFTFEAGATPPTRSIDAPTEWLLLEALRRLDEGVK